MPPSAPVTPFIPPLPNEPSPRPPQRAPLIPEPNGAPHPAWYGGQNLPPPNQYPSSYFQAPVGLPPAIGVSDDWVGFGPLGGTGSPHGPPPPQPYPASAWSYPPNLPPGTPWHAPAAPPGSGYMGNMPLPGMGMGMPQYGMSPYTIPQQFMGYGASPPAAGYPGTPWHGPSHTAPGYDPRMQQMQAPMERWNMDDAPADPVTGARRNRGTSRVRRDEAGIDTRFMIGDCYGPVLDPIQAGAVQVQPHLNPLLTPPPEHDNDQHDYIKWNMLFSSSYAQRSGDSARQSWSKGRHEPAAFPRLSSLRIVSKRIPWVVDIIARNKKIGVTCGEVIDQLSDFLHSNVGQNEFKAFPKDIQRKVSAAYHTHRSLGDDVPGGRMDNGLLRADFLSYDSMFMGLEEDESFVKKSLALNSKRSLPCVWVLRCGRRLSATEDEIRDQELRAEHARRNDNATDTSTTKTHTVTADT